MSPVLPPPFGNSTSIMDRNNLEGVTFAILIVGVPLVVVAVAVAALLIYCCCKKLYTKRYRETVRTNKDAVVTTCTEAVGYFGAIIVVLVGLDVLVLSSLPLWLALIAVVLIAFGGIFLGVLLGGCGFVLGLLLSCPIWIWDVILHHCCGRGTRTKNPNNNNNNCCTRCQNCALPKSCKDHPNLYPEYCECNDWVLMPDKLTAAIMTPLFTSVTKRRIADSSCLLIAERKEPESKLWKFFVRLYFLYTALLALLWFVALLVDFLWYRKVTSCNDINTSNDNYVCYELDAKGIPMPYNQQECGNITDQNKVLCYIYTFSPFMALGIAASVTRTIVFTVDIAVSVALTLAENEYGRALLVVVQLLALCIGSPVFFIVLPVIYTGEGRSISALKSFFDGRSGIRIFIFILTTVTIAALPMVPWWAFEGKRFVDTCQEDTKGQDTDLYKPLLSSI